jgi:hypothetical protein
MPRATDPRDGDRFDEGYRHDQGRESKLVPGLIIGAAAGVLLTCLCGVGVAIVAFVWDRGTQPDELVGTWKGRFVLQGQPCDVEYTLDKSGRFHDQEFDTNGRFLRRFNGRWRFRNGHVEIDFADGGSEKAVAMLLDANTIDYRIVQHTDVEQVGTGTTFRRQ